MPLVDMIVCCSEREAIAAKAPEVTVTGCPGFTADFELVGSMVTSVRAALGGVLVLRDRDAVPGGFAHVQGCPIATIDLYG